MADIKSQKLIYHLTKLENMESILRNGLLPRSHLQRFHDVADQEIINDRNKHGLDSHVPFHWFSRNPFDGRVQEDRPDESFVLITVRRELAQRENWKVIPRHPLANTAPQILDYQQGFNVIDWDTMNRRDYHDHECKNICMAECLAPGPVATNKFFRVYAPEDAVAGVVKGWIASMGSFLDVEVNRGMFLT